MRDQEIKFQFDTSTKQFKREWNVLRSLAEELLRNQIPFKVDGKTMIFAHGLEFPLDKICLTFQWKEEKAIKYFFHYNREVKQTENGFKYFDAIYEGMTVRCMFYGGCPDADTDEFLYRNTDLVQIDYLVIPVHGWANRKTTVPATRKHGNIPHMNSGSGIPGHRLNEPERISTIPLAC